jgi:hypothetical protein
MRVSLYTALVVLLFASCGSEETCTCSGGLPCGTVWLDSSPWGEVGPEDDATVHESGPVDQVGLPDVAVADWLPLEDVAVDLWLEHDLADPDIPKADDIIPDLPPEPTQDGTPEFPFMVDEFPFLHWDDTTTAITAMMDVYSCADWLGEEGNEVYYKVTLPVGATLKAEVAEEDGVDVDLHLLTSLNLDGGMATDCLLRANTQLVAPELEAGDYWLVIDSYSEDGNMWPGAYKLALEIEVWDEWQEKQVADGVNWRKKKYADYAGGIQTINVLEVDLQNPGVTVKPYWGNGCIHPSEVAQSEGAVGAINMGFFSGGCTSLCLIRTDGELKVTNKIDGNPRRSFGLTEANAPMFESVDAGADWPESWQAMGGHPNLVTDGAIDIWPWSDTGFYTSRHPRTGLGATADGRLLLVTVDGRTEAGKGMTEEELAQHMIWLGAVDAINLDGGGSTSMFVEEMSINGIVSHPSDNETPDHHGERLVSDAILVFSNN